MEKDLSHPMEMSKEHEELQSLKAEVAEFTSLRSSNLPASMIAYRKKNQSKKASLKSDLKKSNTFVKKLRSINSEGILQCIRDVDTLNLSLFITEIVNAIIATTFKPIDTSNMVKLCISLHQIYEEFIDHLVTNLKQALLLPISEDDTEASKRKRIQIRFVVELFQVGLFADDEFFIHLLRNLLGKLPLKGYARVDKSSMLSHDTSHSLISSSVHICSDYRVVSVCLVTNHLHWTCSVWAPS